MRGYVFWGIVASGIVAIFVTIGLAKSALIPFQVSMTGPAKVSAGKFYSYSVVLRSQHDQKLTMFGTLASRADNANFYRLPVVTAVKGATIYGKSVKGLLWKVVVPAGSVRTVRFTVRVTAFARYCLRTVVGSIRLSRTSGKCSTVR